MKKLIMIDDTEMEMIDDLLELNGEEIYQKYGLKRNDTITHTFKFENGKEIEVRVVIDEDGEPFTEAILCEGTFQLAFSEPEYSYDGVWSFEYNGQEYIVDVESETTVYQTLKYALIQNGRDAINDFLGYECNTKEYNLEDLLKDVFEQMPEEEISEFYEEFCMEGVNYESND